MEEETISFLPQLRLLPEIKFFVLSAHWGALLLRLRYLIIKLSCFYCLGLFFLESSGAAAELNASETMRDCEICPIMVVIPPGSFQSANLAQTNNSQHAKALVIKNSFAISMYEVSWREWEACAIDGWCKQKPDDHGWGKRTRPVINISWNGAQDYLRWLRSKTGHMYRLPAETEWEYAARAGTKSKYWWGNQLIMQYANCRDCEKTWGGKKTAPVGSFPPNPWGIYDMHGNVWEWTSDCWQNNDYGISTGTAGLLESKCNMRVIRGGSWYYFPRLSQSASRDGFKAKLFSYNVGFRVVRELPTRKNRKR